MGYLDHSRIYLCGQIEHSDDFGVGWRSEITQDISGINPTIAMLNPMVKPNWLSDMCPDSVCFDKESIYRDSKSDRAKKAWQCNKYLRDVCVGLVGISDIIIARISRKFTWGSIHELEIASTLNKPVLFWLPDGDISVYGLPGLVSDPKYLEKCVFDNKVDLLAELDTIDKNGVDSDDYDCLKWLFLTYRR